MVLATNSHAASSHSLTQLLQRLSFGHPTPTGKCLFFRKLTVHFHPCYQVDWENKQASCNLHKEASILEDRNLESSNSVK